MAAKKKQAPEALPRPLPPTATKSESLARARMAAELGQLGEALSALVEAWRVAPAEELADAITKLGALCDASASPLGGRTAKEREEAFQRAAAENRPERLGILLSVVTDTKGSADTQVRLAALCARTSDPRLAARIGGMLASPPYNASTSRTVPFWKFIFAIVPQLGDPRFLDLARELPGKWLAEASLSDHERDLLNRRLAKLIRILEGLEDLRAPTLSAEESSTIAAVIAKLTKTSEPAARGRESRARSERDLLQDVYENPDDDAPRLVHADFLQERSDPRGEMIMLQFRRRDGTLTREEARREKDLIAEHGRRWLGAIEPTVKRKGMLFERGFLAECAAGTIDASWEWNTVHTIFDACPGPEALHLASLRTLEDLTSVTALSRIERPLDVTSLRTTGPHLDAGTWRTPKPVFREADVAEFVRLRCLPRLQKLWLEGWNAWCLPDVGPVLLEWLWESPATKVLEELTLRSALARLAEWRVVAEARGLRRIELDARTDAHNGFFLALERGTSGTLSRLVIAGDPRSKHYFNVGVNLEGGTVPHIAEAIAALPIDTLDEVVLAPERKWSPSDAELAQLDEALKPQRRWKGSLR